jgi:hypothetical protein
MAHFNQTVIESSSGGQVSSIRSQVATDLLTDRRDNKKIMAESDLDDLGQQFLIQLFEQTNGDAAVQVSMYDIGDLLGMDRDTASSVAQELMGRQLAEIHTLSGGIGISADGSARVQKLMGHPASDSSQSANLGNATVLNSGGQQAVGQVVSELKDQTGSLGLDFDSLSEMMADLKTTEAQLDSSRPKTAIIRECLRSILDVVEKTPNRQIIDRLRKLMER